ncbi:hypothetical protein [Pasteuria penetrans]|nr:hypothetical protein [Pasteuria penetrans]
MKCTIPHILQGGFVMVCPLGSARVGSQKYGLLMWEAGVWLIPNGLC